MPVCNVVTTVAVACVKLAVVWRFMIRWRLGEWPLREIFLPIGNFPLAALWWAGDVRPQVAAPPLQCSITNLVNISNIWNLLDNTAAVRTGEKLTLEYQRHFTSIYQYQRCSQYLDQSASTSHQAPITLHPSVLLQQVSICFPFRF